MKAVTMAFELAERYGAKLVLLSAFAGRGASAHEYPQWKSNAAEQVDRILAIAPCSVLVVKTT